MESGNEASKFGTIGKGEASQFGLHCLRNLTTDTSVIFVHGILSDSNEAWGNPSWPELLAAEEEFKDHKIYTFTYRTSFTSRTYSIADAADALREHFAIEELWQVKNIIFICHSMGGIVVRRFLVANQLKFSELPQNIGILLVASPSLGSKDANIFSILSFALKHTQASSLRFSQANTSLDELHRDFKTLLSSGVLRIVGRELIEDRPIRIKRWFGLWSQVVEPFSASAYFSQIGFEPLKIPGADHFTIVKPTTPRSLQHRVLKRFLKEFPILVKSTQHRHLAIAEQSDRMPASEPASMEIEQSDLSNELINAAIALERRNQIELPVHDEAPRNVYDTAVNMRRGRMLERIIASNLVRKCRDPSAVFMCVNEKTATLQEMELIAPWLRFLPKNFSIEGAFRKVCDEADLNDVDALRLKVRLLGWSGQTVFPAVEWNRSWSGEKLSSHYANAYLRAAWRDQSESDLYFLMNFCISANESYRKYYDRDIHYLDFASAVKGIPAGNSKVLLKCMIQDNETPSGMISALLYRMSIAPAVDAASHLDILTRHSDREIAEAARIALAFVPGRTPAIRNLKRSSLRGESGALAAAAGVDVLADAMDELRTLLASTSHEVEVDAYSPAVFYAAWALVRMVKSSRDASRMLKQVAFEHPNKVVRSICLIGLAIESPQEAEKHILDEYESARDLEKFCLSIALTYTSDAREMLSVLANTGEDRLYIPFLYPCFQYLFYAAMEHASKTSPILGEILSLTDDV